MSRFTTMQAEFDKALKKLEKVYESGEKIDRSDFEKLHIWHEFLKTKLDAEREKNATEFR
tara:strand:- start:310 stop:489 length:180 start_codon:yes stop_codon:yes gene_type:complete